MPRTDPDQQVDHRAEALRLLDHSRRMGTDGSSPAMHAAAYALLAIAEGQERVAEEINRLREAVVDHRG
jgi:hypothetical protein